MTPLVTARVALRAILRHKLRAVLTMLGVIFGVGAVIAMVAIGEGAKAQVQAQFSAMGTNLLVVQSGSSQGGGMRGGAGSAATLTWDDLAAIRGEATVKYVSPTLRASSTVVSEEQNWSTQVWGVSPEYFEIRTWRATSGALFGSADVDSGAKVVVLGATVAEKLFGGGVDPLGQTVRIKSSPFTVVAVLEKKGQSGMGQDNDDCVLVPHTAFRSKIQGGLGKYVAGQIYVSTATTEETALAQAAITALLRDRHRLDAGADDDFTVRNMTEFAAAREESTKTLTLLLTIVAAVSLLVGGIGIMNIMLVSVTERTREIGIRMAVGAKPQHILVQFLVESLVLSVSGGLIGVAAGLVTAKIIALESGWPLLVRPDIIAVSVGFSAAVGVIFGLYPAWQASRLDPIQALRYE